MVIGVRRKMLWSMKSINPCIYIPLFGLLLLLPLIDARRRSFLSSSTTTVFSTKTDDWSVTDISVAQGNYTWLVDNYTYILEHLLVHQKVCSQIFSSPEAPEFAFYLCISTNELNHNANDQGAMWLSTYYDKGTSNKINVDVRFALLKVDGQPVDNGLSVNQITLKKGGNGVSGSKPLATSEFILNPANNVLSNKDRIIIYFEYTAYIGWVSYSSDCRSLLREEPARQLGQDIARFKKLKKYYDVTFNVMGKQMHAHKVILAARSAIFATLFEIENDSTVIDVDGIKPEVMTEVLRYIYTNSVQNISMYAVDLLYAADKFDLANLREMCEIILCENITPEIAYDVLDLATKVKAERLRLRAARYISSHLLEIIQTPKFNKIINADSRCISNAFGGS